MTGADTTVTRSDNPDRPRNTGRVYNDEYMPPTQFSFVPSPPVSGEVGEDEQEGGSAATLRYVTPSFGGFPDVSVTPGADQSRVPPLPYPNMNW